MSNDETQVNPPRAGLAQMRELVATDAARPGLQSTLVGLGVPIAIAVVLHVSGRPTFALVVAAMGVTVLLLRLLAPSYGEIFLQALRTFGAWVGGAVSAVLLTLIYVTVFAPAAVVGRWLGRDPLELRPAEGTTWHDVTSDPPVRLFRRTFSKEAAAPGTTASSKSLRLVRRFATVAALLLLLDVGGGGVVRVIQVVQEESRPPDRRGALEVYHDAPWASDYWQEHQASFMSHYEPYVGWRRDDFEGKHVRIMDGVRSTYASPGAADDWPLVFFYGGSTTWGTGSRDTKTLPSEVARLAQEKGHPWQVHNFGESGWVSWQ